MAALRPIHYKTFEQFLVKAGCRLVRQEGDHRVWDRPDLRTLHISTAEYLNVLEYL